MNSKFYISLEAARLLKEKGYNEATEYLHSDDIIYKGICLNYLKPELCGGMIAEDNSSYPCPTKAEAIDWLESKGMLVWAEPTCEDIWMWFIISPLHFEDNTDTNGIAYPTRLEAEEAAIIKALELL